MTQFHLECALSNQWYANPIIIDDDGGMRLGSLISSPMSLSRRTLLIGDGLNRFELSTDPLVQGLDRARANRELRWLLARDSGLLSRIRRWMAFEGRLIVVGRDRSQAEAEIFAAVDRGTMRLSPVMSEPLSTGYHAFHGRLEWPRPAPPLADPLTNETRELERSLLITDCPPVFEPRPPRGETLEILTLLRGFVGDRVELRIRSRYEPEPPLHRRELSADERSDGSGSLGWDGKVDVSGEFVTRGQAPFQVELIAIDQPSYRDEAPTNLPPRRRVTILQFEDVGFATDRSLLLPSAREARGEAEVHEQHPRDDLGGLDVIAAALRFVDANPHKQVLVVGHTDSAGSDAHNLELSRERAENVAAYLSGDAEVWAALCQEHFERADFKTVHRWAAREFDWSCDPGELDNEWHAQAREARDAFRLRCNQELAEFGISLERHVKQNVADWQAIAALYDRALQARLGCDADELAELRAKLSFLGPAILGCGERWPAEAIGLDVHALEDNRRVELLFFDPGEAPELADDPPGVDIYGRGEYLPEYLPPDPHSYEGLRDYEVWVQLRDHWVSEPLPGANYELWGPVPNETFRRSGTTDSDGRLREVEVAPGDYVVQIGESFTVAGARYAGLCYADDRPDVQRMPGLGEAPAHGPRIYDDAWQIFTQAGPDDFIDEIESDDESLAEYEDDDSEGAE